MDWGWGRVGLWCLSLALPLIIFQLISWWSVFWWRKLECPEKTTNLPKVICKLYHIMLYRVHLAWVGFELTTSVVIGTDCIGSYKHNYHMITTTIGGLCLRGQFGSISLGLKRGDLCLRGQFGSILLSLTRGDLCLRGQFGSILLGLMRSGLCFKRTIL